MEVIPTYHVAAVASPRRHSNDRAAPSPEDAKQPEHKSVLFSAGLETAYLAFTL
jgi:hypothetical protein